MKKFTYGLLAATALCAAGMAVTIAPAQARGTVSFEVSLGDVQIAYADGYYDRHRRWHRWHNASERKWYREKHHDSYFGMTHVRDNDHNRRDWRTGKRDDWH